MRTIVSMGMVFMATLVFIEVLRTGAPHYVLSITVMLLGIHYQILENRR